MPNTVKFITLCLGSIEMVHMGESFQDYSWIQDFEADFPKKVSLKMLNSADNNSFSDLISIIKRYLTI